MAEFDNVFHVLGLVQFAMTSIFSEMALHLNDIVELIRNGVVKLPYVFQINLLPHTLDHTEEVILGHDICHGFL